MRLTSPRTLTWVVAAVIAVGASPRTIGRATAATLFQPARGIEIYQNDGDSVTLTGRILKARCSLGASFALAGDSPDHRFHLEFFVPVWQGFNRDYDVYRPSSTHVEVIDHETNQDYDNAYPIPDAPPEVSAFVGIVEFHGKRGKVVFGLPTLPNEDYTALVLVRGGVKCKYTK